MNPERSHALSSVRVSTVRAPLLLGTSTHANGARQNKAEVKTRDKMSTPLLKLVSRVVTQVVHSSTHG